MTWSYTDPQDSLKDEVRFLVGDTNSSDPQLTDEEIQYLLLQNHDRPYAAAASSARAIAAKYARKVDKSVGDLKLSYDQLQKHYLDLYEQLRKENTKRGGTGMVYSGGLEKATAEDNRTNDSLVQPDFTRRQFDNPGNFPELNRGDVFSGI